MYVHRNRMIQSDSLLGRVFNWVIKHDRQRCRGDDVEIHYRRKWRPSIIYDVPDEQSHPLPRSFARGYVVSSLARSFTSTHVKWRRIRIARSIPRHWCEAKHLWLKDSESDWVRIKEDEGRRTTDRINNSISLARKDDEREMNPVSCRRGHYQHYQTKHKQNPGSIRVIRWLNKSFTRPPGPPPSLARQIN